MLTTTDLAVITGIYLATYNVGSALGNTISGAIWTQVLPGELENRLGNATLAAEVYANPFAFTQVNPVGTPDRDAGPGRRHFGLQACAEIVVYHGYLPDCAPDRLLALYPQSSSDEGTDIEGDGGD